MAHILPFRSGTARTEPECETPPPTGARIIIFPGVRRERHAELPAGPRRRETEHPTQSPPRDRLELPD